MNVPKHLAAHFPAHIGRPHGASVVIAAFERGSDMVSPGNGYHFEVFTLAGTFGPGYPEMEGEALVIEPNSDSPVYINPADVVAVRVHLV